MRKRRNVVRHHRHLIVSHATQRHGALTILHRVTRVRGVEQVAAIERTHGPRNASEFCVHQLQRLRLVELAGHHQHGVVRLVVAMVERLQAFD